MVNLIVVCGPNYLKDLVSATGCQPVGSYEAKMVNAAAAVVDARIREIRRQLESFHALGIPVILIRIGEAQYDEEWCKAGLVANTINAPVTWADPEELGRLHRELTDALGDLGLEVPAEGES